MSNNQKRAPVTSWCIEFQVYDPPNNSYSGPNSEHYVV